MTVLANARRLGGPEALTKSGIILGMGEEWDISHPCAFGVCQTTSPVSQSTPIMSTFSPAGAMIAVFPSIAGHWPVYQRGTPVPTYATRSIPHR